MSIMYLPGVSSHTPSTCQEIALRGQLMLLRCCVKLHWELVKMAWGGGGNKGYLGLCAEHSHKFFCIVWLLNVWDESGVGRRKYVRANVCT